MILYGLRLLVALLTFAFGVAAAWLLDFKSEPVSVEREVTAVSVSDSPRSCSLERGRVVEGGILQTKNIDERSLVYPHYAKKVRLGGNVVVKVEVDQEGRVSKAKAMTGFGMLPEAAEKDALDTRFVPTQLNGKPVRVSGVIMYKFVLD
jgi:TonB family protein